MTTYPHLFKVDGRHLPGVPGSLHREITDAAMRVGRRTGTTPWFHAPMMAIQYHIGDEPRGGPADSVLFQLGRYIPIDEHQTVECIYAARVAEEVKDANRDQAVKDSAEEFERRLAKIRDDFDPELKSQTKYLMNKMNGGKFSRNTALI